MFLLANIILTCVTSENTTQEYVIRRDLFNGFKAAEFTVYDTNENQIFYRLESDYGLGQRLRLVKQPSKAEVGRLTAKINLFLYEADISILNPKTNEWGVGSITQNFKFMGNSFDIIWRGRRIKVETKAFAFTTYFYDEDQQVLAQSRRSALVLRRKHDLKIFSDRYLKEIYFLGLAAYDRLISARGKG